MFRSDIRGVLIFVEGMLEAYTQVVRDAAHIVRLHLT